jgi:putative selenate reductase molybdopterin-binding subunit
VSLRLATGQAAFAGDHALAGMLHVALRRSTTAHARVHAADTSAARQAPGVAAVLTCTEAPLVLGDVVRFVGDRLAVVAAEEPEQARRAAELVTFDLETLPAALDAAAAAAAGDEAAVAGRVSVSEGDVERALGEAEHVTSGVWSLPFVPALSLEPPLALTWLDEDRRLVVRTSAESPFRVRGALAQRLALPAARIRVLRPAVAGGGLGRSDLAVEDACALVTLRTGRPAQLALTAAEALAIATGRPAQSVELRLGLTRGRLVALDVRLLVDMGADAVDATALLRASARQALGLYRLPSLRFTGVAVRTNRPPASAPRGSDAGVAVALECALDEAAVLLDQDPAVLRRAQLRRPGDPGALALAALGEPQGGDDARQLAELLGEIEPPGRNGRGAVPAGPLRGGRGLAVARRADSASGQAGAAALRLLDDGSFTLAAGPSTAGSVDELLYADTAAAILGVPARRVVCAAPDTDSAPYLTGDDAPASSAAGRAVEQVATLARDRIREAGAALLGVPTAQATLADGHVSEPSGRRVSFADIGAFALRSGEPLAVTATPRQTRVPHSLAAAVADVEVDVDTGGVEVRSLGAVVAGGPFEDTRQAAAQVEGALVAALEQSLTDGRLPRVTAGDVPALVVSFVPGGDPLSRFGTAAHAEAAARAALAALANAIARAASVRPRVLPLDPARLLAAIVEQEEMPQGGTGGRDVPP